MVATQPRVLLSGLWLAGVGVVVEIPRSNLRLQNPLVMLAFKTERSGGRG